MRRSATFASPTWIIVGIFLTSIIGAIHARDVSLADYRAALKTIRAELDAGHLDKAQDEAAKLEVAGVQSGGMSLKTDVSILRPIRNATKLSEAQTQIPRINVLLKTLSKKELAAVPANAPNTALLDVLRRDEAPKLPVKDGESAAEKNAETGMWESIRGALDNAAKWLERKLGDLMERFKHLFPEQRQNGIPGLGATPWINYTIIVLAAAALGLALRAYLKRRRSKPSVAAIASISTPMTAKDADPLSRGSNEWEAYAAQLASDGRYREAVRAWYHAVLVLLFRSGVLSYRKGRTNWEYYFSFPADFAFRRDFQDLTGAFEAEWYGKAQSEPDDARRYAESAKAFLTRARARRNA